MAILPRRDGQHDLDFMFKGKGGHKVVEGGMDLIGVWGGCDNRNPLFEILKELKK